ncbi:energy transducer TonB [Chryseobacterium geocarposphaerae]|uniref:Protein TonB n=1 Tax=Chryseobacterium geocarposphaerae TaxID=1416776 RepID=A0A2M9BXS3_9FLAO|nr:energy transducer TonB [Chryseobacterium geocarposphaerae]PJJ62884.1 protein TonB [Chryseobacterium geocarposphaerae]
MKHLHQNQEFRFNEVLFEHRNKEYGAYVLRNESDRILTKALFVGVSLLAAVSITPFVINAFKSSGPIEKIPTSGPFIITDVYEQPDTPPVKVEPVKPTTPPNVKTYDSRVAEPKRDAVESEKKKIPDDAVAGLSTNLKADPAPINTYVPPTTIPTSGTGPVAPYIKPEAPKVDKNKIETELSAEANFSGGIESFRNKVMNNFDGSGFESDGIMRTTITFIVEIDGTISGIKASGANADFNNEAIRTIKAISAKGKWTPGKNKQGESVRSAFKFPISMKFDN